MSTDWIKNNLEVYLPPFVIIVIGIVLGLFFKRYIHSRLKLVAKKSDWAGDDAVLDAIEPHNVVWFFLGSQRDFPLQQCLQISFALRYMLLVS